MTSKPVRLDEELVSDAAAEASLMHRSTTKQIEYWADIGRRLSKALNPEDLLKVSLGLASLQVQAREADPVSPETVEARLAALRDEGDLPRRVTRAKVAYEASGRPGLLYRIQGGRRELGYFEEGQFVPAALPA